VAGGCRGYVVGGCRGYVVLDKAKLKLTQPRLVDLELWLSLAITSTDLFSFFALVIWMICVRNILMVDCSGRTAVHTVHCLIDGPCTLCVINPNCICSCVVVELGF
jgi:hypothetical protein